MVALPFSVLDCGGKLFWRTSSAWLPFFVCLNFYPFTFLSMSLRLLDNEQVVCTLEKTRLIWVTPSVLWIISFYLFLSNTYFPNGGVQLFLIIFFVWFVVELIRRYRYAGYVTNKRIVLHYGLFLHEREMRFEQLEWVQVERYKAIFWHQIHISGTGGTSTMFDYAGNYDEFKTAIYDAKEKIGQIKQ